MLLVRGLLGHGRCASQSTDPACLSVPSPAPHHCRLDRPAPPHSYVDRSPEIQLGAEDLERLTGCQPGRIFGYMIITTKLVCRSMHQERTSRRKPRWRRIHCDRLLKPRVGQLFLGGAGGHSGWACGCGRGAGGRHADVGARNDGAVFSVESRIAVGQTFSLSFGQRMGHLLLPRICHACSLPILACPSHVPSQSHAGHVLLRCDRAATFRDQGFSYDHSSRGPSVPPRPPQGPRWI